MSDSKYIESFSRRGGRLSQRQKNGLAQLNTNPEININLPDDFERFAQNHQVVVEIGFGMGEDLLHRALAYPDVRFIGVDVYPPGVGHLASLIIESSISNIRIAHQDAMDLLRQIPDQKLDAVHLFFPDPWPKKRHHKRRLACQGTFIDLIAEKLKQEGIFYFVTDWESYYEHVNDTYKGWVRSEPIVDRLVSSKYERRGVKLSHEIYELSLSKPLLDHDAF